MDAIMITKDSNGLYNVSDRYSDDYARPIEDRLQNYELLSGPSAIASELVFKLRRPRDSCDYFDVSLKPEEVNFCLWAMGTHRTNHPRPAALD